VGARRPVSSGVAYLDASAAVKLLRAEPETAALRAALASAGMNVSSELLEVELRCVALREGGMLPGRAAIVLAGVDLVPFTAAIRTRAGQAFDPPQRALDAIHLATALDLQLPGLSLVTYDERQADGGTAAGLPVISPT
jgi:predicted nucleic acid-binding protein